MAAEVSRDIRGFAQDSKRDRDHKNKWSRGTRPSAGVKCDFWEPDMLVTGSESQKAKVRPGVIERTYRSPTSNVAKASYSPRHHRPGNATRTRLGAMEEINDSAITRSLIDLLPPPGPRQPVVMGDHLNYVDRAGVAPQPVTLELFVKTSPKETEKLVEKEYEILDYNGDALKGRKARQNLRRKNNAAAAEPDVIEDDGFELV